MTVVTQFITDDGSDTGDLVEIRRLYVQNGRVIENSAAVGIDGLPAYDSITDEMCADVKTAFGDPNDHAEQGGLKASLFSPMLTFFGGKTFLLTYAC